MFRFLVLHWNPAQETAAARAEHWLAHLTHHRQGSSWSPVWRRPGLAVLLPQVRGHHHWSLVLPAQQGVVLGTLFHRDPGGPEAACTGTQSGRVLEARRSAMDTARDLVDHHWGRYVALIEAPDGSHHVLRDPSGALPCHRMTHLGVGIVFCWLEDVLCELPTAPSIEVDWAAVAGHIAFGELTGHACALRGVCQVLPGEMQRLDTQQGESGQWSQCGQWAWDARQRASLEPIEDVEAAGLSLRKTTRHCVQSWSSGHDALVLRLSGGVDSSILASCLGRQSVAARATCLNYHSPGADGDERHYARLAAARAGLDLVELARDPHFPLQRVMDVARMPNPTHYLGRIGAQSDAQIAEKLGARALFTGGGGDQLFFEFKQWWPAADHLRRHGLGKGFLPAALDAARLGRLSLWRTLGLAIADRWRTHPPAPNAQRPWTLASEAVWAAERQASTYLHPANFEACDLPIGKLMQVLQLSHFAGYHDPYERERAPELVHPLLSQPLIELCLRIPTYLLTLGGRGRGLARLAFAQDLPPEVAARRSKGGMQEQIGLLLRNNLAFVRETLLDGELVRQRLVDRPGLERALANTGGAAPVRAGEIHMYLSVEAWLRPWMRP